MVKVTFCGGVCNSAVVSSNDVDILEIILRCSA